MKQNAKQLTFFNTLTGPYQELTKKTSEPIRPLPLEFELLIVHLWFLKCNLCLKFLISFDEKRRFFSFLFQKHKILF